MAVVTSVLTGVSIAGKIGGLFGGGVSDTDKVNSAHSELANDPNTRSPDRGVLRLACQAGFSGATQTNGDKCKGVGSKSARARAGKLLNAYGIRSIADAQTKEIRTDNLGIALSPDGFYIDNSANKTRKFVPQTAPTKTSTNGKVDIDLPEIGFPKTSRSFNTPIILLVGGIGIVVITLLSRKK